MTGAETLVAVLTVSLGAWRLAYAGVFEDGPANLFEQFRQAIGVPPRGEPEAEEPPLLAVLFSCPFCLSFWTSLVLFLLWQVAPGLVGILAAWGGATLIEMKRR